MGSVEMQREKVFMVRGPRCLVPRCNRDASCRGLCRSCYQAAYMLVTSGSVTWQQLEARGKVNEVRTVKDWLLE